MQLQFRKIPIACLQRLKGEVQVQEQTQELRLPEEMPDVGSVLGTWGQVLVRGKEWHAGGMSLSCGVMTWAMYLPEDASEPRMVEAWIPFSLQWDLPASDHDGRMNVSCLLRSIEARPVSARRLMFRATVSAYAEAWTAEESAAWEPENVPEDVHLLQKTYPMRLPKEVGEKAFQMEEDLTLPSSMPGIDRLLRFSLQPELMEKKMMAGKLIFRGVGRLHLLYRDQTGVIQSYDMELPFSQYADLEQLYDEQADAWVGIAVTSLELDQDLEGALHLHAGLIGQYVVNDVCPIAVVEDAYSPKRQVTPQMEEMALPILLDDSTFTLTAEQSTPVEMERVLDVAFFPDQPRQNRGMDAVEAELSGVFQVLYCDAEGTVNGANTRWHGAQSIPADRNTHLQSWLMPTGVPQAVPGGEWMLRCDTVLQTQTMASQGISAVSALEIGEEQVPDPNRPSLILRRAGTDTLWQIAKNTGTTVDAIREANQLQSEPVHDRLLLIPIP